MNCDSHLNFFLNKKIKEISNWFKMATVRHLNSSTLKFLDYQSCFFQGFQFCSNNIHYEIIHLTQAHNLLAHNLSQYVL